MYFQFGIWMLNQIGVCKGEHTGRGPDQTRPDRLVWSGSLGFVRVSWFGPVPWGIGSVPHSIKMKAVIFGRVPGSRGTGLDQHFFKNVYIFNFLEIAINPKIIITLVFYLFCELAGSIGLDRAVSLS